MSYFANLGQALRHQAYRLGEKTALRHRRHGLFRDISWRDYHDAALAGASALVLQGVQPADRVGILAENSADWLIADMAILIAGAVTVSPHAPLTARQVHYQFQHSGTVWCFVSNATQLAKLASVRAGLPQLRGVVSFEPLEGARWWPGFRLEGRRALARAAGEVDQRLATVGRDDLAAIMYTSGTTGDPKGVMLTHGNLLSNAEACTEVQPHKPEDVILSWLPYTHIYARTVDHYAAVCDGTTLAISASAESVVPDLADVRPTHMAAVPRFYEKLLAAFAHLEPEKRARRLRDAFGGRLDWISSGGAPLPVAVAQEYHAAGIQLMQGYGLTESSPVISFNKPGAHKLGTVGRAIPGVRIRISDEGEVLTQGPHVMRGYWRDEEATAKTIKDGWLYTGDLGTIDEDGYLSITGRKKELMVLSNGKKVVPTYLEGLLGHSPFIDQAVVAGEGRNFLVALVVPKWDAVRAELKLQGEPEQLAGAPAVRDLLLAQCREALDGLSHMEQIKKVLVLPRAFSVEADEVTVSLKLRRAVVLQKHAEALEKLYQGEE